jgi:Family of unknown function (DUF6588)
MKSIKPIILAFSLLITTSSFAQFEDFLRGGKADANLLLNNYMTPFLKGMGYGFNNGWYNTAKPHETLGFDLTISFNAAIVPVVDQSFEFVDSDYSNTRIQSGSTSLPTLMGGNTTTVLENFIQNPPPLPPGETVIGSYPAPDGIGDDIGPYTFNQIAVPSPIIQAGIGIIKGTEIKVRWMPTVNNQDFSFKYFGVGGLHSLSQWIPVIKDLPFLDISAFLGYTTISAEYAIPVGNIVGEGQRATFDVNTFTYQLLASAHVSVITGYIGIGADNFKTSFKMLGTYDPYPNAPIPDNIRILEDPVILEQSGNGGFRTTMGVRLKLAIFTLNADYTFREYNTLTVGLGFSFR